MQAMGVVGVNRENSNSNFVGYVVDLFDKNEDFHLIFCPEGTRQAAYKWKTGFYHAALEAGVPLVLTYLDYKEKIACVYGIVYPTGDYERDMEPIQEIYKDVSPRYPENYNQQIY